jgi:precorrin-3B C17-methyltransferase
MSGVLNLVSVGPGFDDLIAPRAVAALQGSDVIVAYELYLRWIGPHVEGKEIHTPPLTQERERALLAIEKARGGATVALISSGDIGIYAMAALAFEEMGEDDTYAVNVIPGITSANACASLLGSPLSHDFATLSLSDLLCPWDWIELRARHIAQADLACVLYNVQSAGRQQGVYRVLQLMLGSKAPHTLCGVVKNAYRPGQQVSIHRLDELPSLQFDMLTTIVIGNRFTKKKRGHIYTPRGYNDWSVGDTAVKESPRDAMPQGAAWVFSGTSDGNALARALAENFPVVVSAATEHGGTLAAGAKLTVWAGRQGVEARRQALVASNARVLVDATHPYATLMSEQLVGLARELNIPYLRYERASDYAPSDGVWRATPQLAAQTAIASGQRIFLATGSKDLATYLQAPGAQDKLWFLRLTADPELIERALALGVPRERICAMQGPFSSAFNEALWRDWRIDCVVTKDSGAAGGYGAKVEAVRALGIALVVQGRPVIDYPRLAGSTVEVMDQLRALGIA